MSAPCLFREARLNIDPANSQSTIRLNLAEPNGALQLIGRSPPRRQVRDTLNRDVDQNEDSFARNHLASEASIFFRPKNRYPRCLSWRLLDERKLLEIQSVDLHQDRADRSEAIYTLLLSFPDAVRPFSITFADADDQDALNVFAITTASTLYTLTLKREFFTQASATEGDFSSWCSSFKPPCFNHRYPYRLFVASSEELYVSLHDGMLLQLKRKSGEDGSNWRETYFSEGGWTSSLRGLVRWQGHNRTRFENLNLEANVAAAVAVSPDKTHLITLTLDQQLKFYSLQTGKVTLQRDLFIPDPTLLDSTPRPLLPTDQRQALQIIEIEAAAPGDQYYIATFTPRDHEFKFWAVRDADSMAYGIRDLHPDFKFVPPVEELLNSNIWSLDCFHIKPGAAWTGMELWLQARSGTESAVFMIKFDLLDETDRLAKVWPSNWVTVDRGTLEVKALKRNAQFPGDHEFHAYQMTEKDSAQQWLDFLFFPGRFSSATLEAALHLYRSGLGLRRSNKRAHPSSQGPSLIDRICAAVASTVTIKAGSQGSIQFETFQEEIASQWHVFYGLVSDLHRRRAESLSLVYDEVDEMAWLALADYVAPLRGCSKTELLALNAEKDIPPSRLNELSAYLHGIQHDRHSEEASAVLFAASYYRSKFSPTASMLLRNWALSEASNASPGHSFERIESLYEAADVGEQCSDEDFEKVGAFLAPVDGFKGLRYGLWKVVVLELRQEQKGQRQRKTLTRFGSKSLIRGAQEALQLSVELLFDLLALCTAMSLEFDEKDRSEKFEPEKTFSMLLKDIKEHSLLGWLSSRVPEDESRFLSPTKKDSSKAEKDGEQSPAATPVSTLLEHLMLNHWDRMSVPNAASEPYFLTYCSRAWVYGINLSTHYDDIAAYVMGFLLRNGGINLADDFLTLLPDNAWCAYLRGRLSLVEGDYQAASHELKSSAKKLSESQFSIQDIDTSIFLDPEERTCFGSGTGNYYYHITTLFDKAKVHSYAADFAQLALKAFASDPKQDEPQRHSDLLARLFNAAHLTEQWDLAYQAIVDYQDKGLQRAALRTLIVSMCHTSQAAHLLEFEFPGLENDVDATLVQLVQTSSSDGSTSGNQFLASTTSSTSSLLASPTSSNTLFNKQPSQSEGAPQYDKILYAWRMQHGDLRGAAHALWSLLQRLKTKGSQQVLPIDPASGLDAVVQTYLAVINTLSCMGEDNSWLLVEKTAGSGASNLSKSIGPATGLEAVPKRRKIVTLEDVRREYHAELDRLARMERGQFALATSPHSPSGADGTAQGGFGLSADADDVWAY